MKEEMLTLDRMVMIGAAGRNCGKTSLALALIKAWRGRFPMIALKVTTIHDAGGSCVRGHEGCGTCTRIKGSFDLVEETEEQGDKDTRKLLASGVGRVFWLRCHKEHLTEGIEYFLSQISRDAVIICESNSLREVVKPGRFIMLKNPEDTSVKPSAAAVMDLVDDVVENDFGEELERFARGMIAPVFA